MPEYDNSNGANECISELRHLGTMYATAIVSDDVVGAKGGAGDDRVVLWCFDFMALALRPKMCDLWLAGGDKSRINLRAGGEIPISDQVGR